MTLRVSILPVATGCGEGNHLAVDYSSNFSESMLCGHHLSQMIAEIYPDMDPGHLDQYFLERSILSPHNVGCGEFNSRLWSPFLERRGSITVLTLLMRMVKASNTLQNIFNPLISLPSAPTRLILKLGLILMVLRNLDHIMRFAMGKDCLIV